MQDERRKDYQDLSEIKVALATIATELKNVVEVFHKHQAEDEKVEERVRGLEGREQFLLGKIAIVVGIAFLAVSKFKVW